MLTQKLFCNRQLLRKQSQFNSQIKIGFVNIKHFSQIKRSFLIIKSSQIKINNFINVAPIHEYVGNHFEMNIS